MRQAVQARVGRGAVLVTIVLVVLSIAFIPPQDGQQSTAMVAAAGNGLFLLACALVGLLIIQRRPGNRVGWIYVLVALGFSATNVVDTYVSWAVAEPPVSLPGAVWAAPFLDVGYLLTVPPGATMLLLLFPSGHLPSSRWRVVVWLLAAGTVIAAICLVLTPGTLEYYPDASNPLGLESAASELAAVLQVSFLVVIVSLAAAAASLVVRWRRARDVERQQMKWLALAGAGGIAVYIGIPSLTSVLFEGSLHQIVNQVVFAVVALLFPIASAIAIFRHRLYDIDRLVSRTVSYGLLTGLLAAVYLAVVFVLQQLVSSAAGDSQLAVAGATLTVAALFRPARRRIQRAVDRRFNRARYDARRTVESFSTRLRNQVNLEDVSSDLVATVQASVQPDAASLWLRASATQRPAHGLRR